MQHMKVKDSSPEIFRDRASSWHLRHLCMAYFLPLFALTTSISGAQDLLVKPLQGIESVGAGGAKDEIKWSVLPKIGELLKAPLIIENIIGTGGVVGTGSIARASTALVTNPHLQKRLTYDTAKNFSYICRIGKGPYIILEHPS